MDSDFETTQNIIIKLLGRNIVKTIRKEKDSKTQLQEIVQASSTEFPVYNLVEMTGKPHDPQFKIEVTAYGFSLTGTGNSKKKAEHDAASKMIKKLKECQRC